MTTPASPSPSAAQPQPPSPAADPARPMDRRAAAIGGVMLAIMALIAIGLVVLVGIGGGGRGLAGGSPTPGPSDYRYASVIEAPPLRLTDQDGKPFDLASLRGQPAFVFFGYTHCPDVCPATVGVVNQVLAAVSTGPRAVFASIDPERDDVAAMKNYVRYLPAAYIGLSGSSDEIAANAAGWGVKYARIDQGSAGGYAMAHTADIFLVDARGRLRAHFPFGTKPEPMIAELKVLLAETPAAAATPTASGPVSSASAPAASLKITVVSTSIWAGGPSPIIVTVGGADGMPLDGSVKISFRVIGAQNAQAGADVPATAILPMGERVVSFVGYVEIPSPGDWRLDVVAADGRTGSALITALDQGATARIGETAPDVDTPTLDDVGGDVKQITTVVGAIADPRLYSTSIADARAAGRPYVLVIDSNRFRVSPACGRAITMVRYLLDRWPDVTFVHLEPFVYQVITQEPVLSGDITNPPLNRWTTPWGMGDATWPATAMPWIFVVDGTGVIRAKYTGIVGSADVDVIVSMMTGNGVLGGG